MLGKLFIGEKVRLTSVNPEDVQTMTRWYQDSEFMRYFDATTARPRQEEQIQRWRNDMREDKDSFYFAIRPLHGDEIVGIVDVGGILWTHGVGWLGIAIGEPHNRGQGYGYDAMRLVLDFSFFELNLHRVQLTVFSYNEPAIRLYEKLGFVREGVQREALHRDGKRFDILMYAILRHEWGKDRDEG